MLDVCDRDINSGFAKDFMLDPVDWWATFPSIRDVHVVLESGIMKLSVHTIIAFISISQIKKAVHLCWHP